MTQEEQYKEAVRLLRAIVSEDPLAAPGCCYCGNDILDHEPNCPWRVATELYGTTAEPKGTPPP